MGYCDWAKLNERNKIYHDTEWGRQVHNDILMFEHLSLECLQCGLSWDLTLKKRDVFRSCFDHFDFEKIAEYSKEDVDRILQTPDMIRSPRKVAAIINNAKCACLIRREYGSFSDYFWKFSNGHTILYTGHNKAEGQIPVSNGLSVRISKALKKRGFQYIGPITVYSHLQACGIINDHEETCPCYQDIVTNHPVVTMQRDKETYHS